MPLIGKLWLEMKMAWKDWHLRGDKASNFDAYLNGASKTHSFAQDFDKLSMLTAEHGQYAGELLIGLDSIKKPMIENVSAAIEKIDLRFWRQMGPETWIDRNCSDYRFHLWFFCKGNPSYLIIIEHLIVFSYVVPNSLIKFS